jgi:hypothetical protein
MDCHHPVVGREVFVMWKQLVIVSVVLGCKPADAPHNDTGLIAQHRRAYELFNKKDPAMFELFADDIVETSNAEPQPIVGKKALIEMNQEMWKGIPDIHVDVDSALAQASFTVVTGHLRGTKDGKPMDVPFVEVVEWKDGKARRSYPFMQN